MASKREWAIEIIAFLFVLLFLYAAANKLLDYQKFTVQIGQSPLLTGFGGSIPWLVIAIEILISILLIVPRFRLVGLFAAFSLMTMFTAYIWAILNFSSSIPCSCGGILEKLGWQEHLIFNSGFVVLGIAGIVLQAQVGAQGSKETKTDSAISETQNSMV
jgi:uncharacterized membrane protein YphA (DoxX/SURF4 family)